MYAAQSPNPSASPMRMTSEARKKREPWTGRGEGASRRPNARQRRGWRRERRVQTMPFPPCVAQEGVAGHDDDLFDEGFDEGPALGQFALLQENSLSSTSVPLRSK